MSKGDLYVHYRHRLDHAREVVALAQGKARSDLDTVRTLNLALARVRYEPTEPMPGWLRRVRLHRSLVARIPGSDN